jgi:hypothetical protein
MHPLATLARLVLPSRKTHLSHDRRIHARVLEPDVRAVCQFHRGCQGASWWSARLLDISAGGIGLVQERDVPIGSQLTIELSNATQSFNRRFLIHVVHVGPQGDSRRVGASFVRPLKPEELQALISER